MTEKKKFIRDLYAAKARSLTQYAYHLLPDWKLAEDLVHKTFIVLMLKADEVMLYKNPAQWLVKTLYKIYMNEKKRKHLLYEVPLNEEEMGAAQEPENKDSLLEIMPVILSPEDQQILQWYFGSQLSYSEIAKRLGINEAAARKRVSRAVQHCSRRLKKI